MKSKLANNLIKTLRQEEQKVKDKFEKADFYLPSKELSKDGEKDVKELKLDKLVREGISLPQDEAAIVETIKGRITKAGFYPTKSELFRAGIIFLSSLPDNDISNLILKLPRLKPGRKKL